MDFDSYARRLWAGRADAYEHGFARLTVHAVGALLDAAGVGTGTRVLDVGMAHIAVARDLGDDRRGRNRRAGGIAIDDRALRPLELRHGEAIHETQHVTVNIACDPSQRVA